MKKIIYTLGFAALAILSCKKETPIDYAVLSGKITNTKTDKLTLSNANGSFKETIKIESDGSFIDTLKVEPGTYRLMAGKKFTPVYLSAGDNVAIHFDVDDFDNSLTFSGQGSEISNYLLTKRKKEKELLGEGFSFYELEEVAYKTKALEIKNTMDKILSSAAGIPEDYRTKEKRNLNYDYLNRLSTYGSYHSYVTKKPDFKPSEGFLNELDNMGYDNEEDFLFSGSYKGLVRSYFDEQAKEIEKTDSIAHDIAYLKTLGTISNNTIKNNLLFESARYGITYTDDLETFYNIFQKHSTNEEHKKEITKSYNKLKTVAKGEPSPKFEGYENFAGGTTSLEDFKGKYVYVDVWATWCGPCKAEIPSLKKVEEKYHGKNIEFVSISVDKVADRDKWTKMIEEKELKGVQLMADNAFQSDFVQDYLIMGIPRFILIDPNGNIVNSNAPRPSDKKLIKIFDALNL